VAETVHIRRYDQRVRRSERVNVQALLSRGSLLPPCLHLEKADTRSLRRAAGFGPYATWERSDSSNASYEISAVTRP
jgi:hypothetical protein